MTQDQMHELLKVLKELNWFYSNRKGYILPIGYEDCIIAVIRNASENRWDEVPALLDKLRNMRTELICSMKRRLNHGDD